MKARIVLPLLVLFIITFGSCQLLRGAELVDFQKKVDEYKSILGANELVRADVNDAREAVINAGTPEEKAEAYATLTKNMAETIVNYKKAEKALDDVLATLEEGIDMGDEGGATLQGELDNYMGDIDFVFEEMQETILNMGTNTDMDDDLKETVQDNKALFLDMFKNAKKEKKELMSLLEGKGSSENAIDNLRATFKYAKSMLSFSRQMHTIDFKITAAVGKVTGLQEKLSDLMESSFQGMSPDEYLEGIHSDQYDASYMNLILVKDLKNVGTDFNFLGKEYQKKLKLKIKAMKSKPKPGSVKDNDKSHAYFYDRKAMRWFWVDKDNPRGEKNYAPFDYEAGTGLYIKYKAGRWYSFAPIYNGQDVEIFPDSTEEQPDSTEEQIDDQTNQTQKEGE
ncbi:MAG: hypothetical protein CMI55_04795 [Parcubacteria group bacterium]|nr:hypothetical protein [Parcubacteria group bacterium]